MACPWDISLMAGLRGPPRTQAIHISREMVLGCEGGVN